MFMTFFGPEDMSVSLMEDVSKRSSLFARMMQICCGRNVVVERNLRRRCDSYQKVESAGNNVIQDGRLFVLECGCFLDVSYGKRWGN
jgi:hypothetical protein